MNTDINHASATIYQFPVRGRFAATPRHDEMKRVSEMVINDAALGGSWYHEAAVRETETIRKP